MSNSIYGLIKLFVANIFPWKLLGENMQDIYNYIEISDLITTSGQPTKEQFPAIQASGYEVVVNLALFESMNALPDEKLIVESLGMQYIHIPVLWENPTLANITDFFDVMNANVDKKVFVHCAANMRVSAFVYLYRRIEGGVSEEQAAADLHKIWIPNEIWQKFIQSVLDSYQAIKN
jgi:protein tyrosine phosphatase (PTP) superfamily phosphohydrolase (DUF442 family)